MTHESSDESESVCGPYWVLELANSEFKHGDDGWGASRESPLVPPGSPSSSNHLGSRVQTQMLQGARGRSENAKSN